MAPGHVAGLDQRQPVPPALAAAPQPVVQRTEVNGSLGEGSEKGGLGLRPGLHDICLARAGRGRCACIAGASCNGAGQEPQIGLLCGFVGINTV